ncbi:MAG TPA: outer membrane lipoprotein-sorting protein [Bacteroidota bacterium]|nr:outer membrane lipoprotein-sorting protein [Bacteroidota bacterium]
MKRCRNIIFIAAAIIASFSVLHSQKSEEQSSARPTGDEILRLSDLNRNGWTSYSVMTTILNYEDNDLKEEGLFEVSMKGMDKTLVKFMNADVKGEYLLMVEDDMWIYMPNTRKPIRITPLQRLMGNASNGDVARTRYAEDYSARIIKEESVEGVPCYLLELNAKRDGATYKRIEYWVEKETKRPKKAEMYLLSGKHFKSITFDRYEEVSGRTLLTQMTITDRLREGRTTIMKYASYAEKQMPEKYFNKDYLEKLR